MRTHEFVQSNEWEGGNGNDGEGGRHVAGELIWLGIVALAIWSYLCWLVGRVVGQNKPIIPSEPERINAWFESVGQYAQKTKEFERLKAEHAKLQRFHEDLIEQAREMAFELNAYRAEEVRRQWN